MHALLYMTGRSFRNRLKKAFKKPLTYVAIVICVLYGAMIIAGWAALASNGGTNLIQIFVYILTIVIYFFFCANFISYAKLKGIIFQKSHSHLIFPAPISPKIILLYGAAKNFIVNFVIYLLVSLVGITIFHLSFVKALFLFFILFACETMFEGGLIVFLYAKEEKYNFLVKIICRCIYVLIGVIALIVVFYIKENGVSFSSVEAVFHLPALQMVPVAGWGVAAVRLILTGPTLLNVIGTILYIVSSVAMFLVAYRMKCTGSYYEDAAKFADDYAEMKSKSKKGEMVLSVGAKKHYRKAHMKLKGSGAKAIFEKQLLEYRKEKYFIFSGTTVFSVAAALLAIFVFGIPESVPPGLSLIGIMAYVIFISAGYLGKWGKELSNFYIYLIPDSAAKKLWYATAMEHVKALVDGTIMAVSVGIAWRIPVWQVILSILIYVVLQASRLYVKILSECILGNTFGSTAKSLFAMLLQGGVIGAGIGIAALLGYFVNYNLVFPIILIYSMMVTVLIGWITTSRFETMEQWD